MKTRSNRLGFTMLELMVTMGLSVVLLAVLLPAVQAAREAARRLHCQNNIRQITLSLHSETAANSRIPKNTPDPWTIKTVRSLSPTILAKSLRTGTPEEQIAWDTSPAAFEPITYFLCPTATKKLVDDRSVSNYALNQFLPGLKLEQLRDGTSQTLLIGEIPSDLASLWTWGPLAESSNISSQHADIVSISMADGSIQSISKQLDRKTLEQLMNPNDGY